MHISDILRFNKPVPSPASRQISVQKIPDHMKKRPSKGVGETMNPQEKKIEKRQPNCIIPELTKQVRGELIQKIIDVNRRL